MIEVRVFELLSRSTGAVELRQACDALPYDCRSIRKAFNRLRERGAVETAKAGATRFFFLVRDAVRPEDRRGCRKR